MSRFATRKSSVSASPAWLLLLVWAGCGEDAAVTGAGATDAAANNSEDSALGTPPDGSTVLADGAIILPDGAVWSPDAQAIAGDTTSSTGDATEVGKPCGLKDTPPQSPQCYKYQCVAKKWQLKLLPAGSACTTNPGVCVANGMCFAGECLIEKPQCVGNPVCCKPCSDDTGCDDGSSCTVDVCDQSSKTCVFSLSPKCSPNCATAADCSDGIATTTDSCEAGTCQHVGNVGLLSCTTFMDCGPSGGCTTTECLSTAEGEGSCSYAIFQTNSNGLSSDCSWECAEYKDCIDANPCTDDACNPATGKCKHTLRADCGPARCAEDAECDDSNLCTVDTCSFGPELVKTCKHLGNSAIEGCCSEYAQCDDGLACTEDQCGSDAHCQHKSSCDVWPCKKDSDCRLFEPSSVQTCLNGMCVSAAKNDWGPGCECLTDGNCGGPGLCVYGGCVDCKCRHFTRDCDDNDPCTLDACLHVSCIHTPIPGCIAAKCTGEKSTECEDGNPCTYNFCHDGTCHSYAKHCDDGKPCTSDFCDPVTGKCTVTPVAGCVGKGP